MAKQKAKFDLPPCPNIECDGKGLRTRSGSELVWKCSKCEQTWPRERMFD